MKIILSFRKFSTGDTARRIHTMLSSVFGPNSVLAGTESMAAFSTDGQQDVIDAVMDADVLLVLIDRDWLSGGWVQEPSDSDVMAINTALFEPSTEVIPLLLDGAYMPPMAELPVTLHELTRQRPVRISSATLDIDIRRLIQQLDPNASLPQRNNPFVGQQGSYSPPQQAYPYQQQFPVPQRTSTADPNIVFVVDLVAGLFGFVGVGHMLNGQIGKGIAFMVGYWVWWVVAIALTALSLGIFMCVAIPASLGFVFYSAYQAREYALGH
jgi:TM2 domain-containing membrane protein YozV